jgi:hypothetical protein
MMVALLSCAKKADVWERAKVDEVKMTSFGFYAVDNPGVLQQDYVIENISTTNIIFQLPPDVDRSGLIARFTVSDNDLIRVGGTAQKSGETVNDFRVPVDYFLSDGNYNAKYSVSIAKGSDFVWRSVPFTINDSTNTSILKVNPVTGDPYIMYFQSRSPVADGKGAMAFMNNGEWANTVISDGRISTNFDFTFNSTGIPYASIADYTASAAQAQVVKRFDGAAWSVVGNQALTPVKISYNTLAFATDEKLLAFSTYDAVGGGFIRRELGFSSFENNAWTIGTKMPGRPSNQVAFWQKAVRKNGAAYLGVLNSGSGNTISIYKYANNSWTTLVDLWRDPNATAIHTDEFDIDVDNDGNVYIAFADNSNAATQKNRVIRYTAATQAITPVGGYIAGSSGFDLDLALSPDGVPYLFYRNANNYPAIVSFDAGTQDWSVPHIFEPAEASSMSLDFAPNGEAWASYLKSRKLSVFKYVKQ